MPRLPSPPSPFADAAPAPARRARRSHLVASGAVLLSSLMLGCGAETTTNGEPTKPFGGTAGKAGSTAGNAGATSGGAGTSSAGTSGSAGSSGAKAGGSGGGGTSGKGGTGGKPGAAGKGGASGTSGAGGTDGAGAGGAAGKGSGPTGGAAGGGGGPAGGAAGAGGAPGPVVLPQVDKVDVLFMIDNSASMADKQAILAAVVPDVVNRLVRPDCVSFDATGKLVARQAPNADGSCAAGLEAELAALGDIHIGVITSSLGAHGADLCDPAKNGVDENDHARLVTRGTGGTVTTWDGAGFLQWDPAALKTPAGDTNAATITASSAQLLRGVGQTGCGYESSLEAWYRFLVEPNPPAEVKRPDSPGQLAELVGTDDALLQQRAEFLRPDSLVAVVVLSDENDCSTAEGVLPKTAKRAGAPAAGWTLDQNGSFPANYLTNQGALVAQAFRMKSGTTACAADPTSSACKSCFVDTQGPGCKTLPMEDDNLTLRCWDQKRRFGVDTLYPVQRYIDGLRESTVFDLRAAPGGDAPLVDNPLFQDLPYLRFHELEARLAAGAISKATFDANVKRLGDAGTRQMLPPRSPRSVVFTAIVGVPWQDLAKNPKDLAEGYLATDQIAWPVVRQTDGAPPTDPLMRESNVARSGVHPVTKETIGLASTNTVNGHEWDSNKQELMYACLLPLPTPHDCHGTSDACDCVYGSSDTPPDQIATAAASAGNPLCQASSSSPYGETQYWAKAYPGGRFVEVAHALASTSVLASICAPNVADASRADYGYRPAIDALVAKVRGQRKL